MISGVHILFHSQNAEADRAFFRDVLEFPALDIGRGWLLFALPPAEAAVHPADGAAEQIPPKPHALHTVVYLMCDDVRGVIATLAAKQVVCGELHEERWGMRTTIRLPSGGEIGLYQPTHQTAFHLGAR
jgi:hypothetical protein